MREKKKLEKAYKKRNKYSMREHKFERYTTIVLLFGFLIGLVTLYFKMNPAVVILTGIIFVALIFRVIAGYSHRKEKKLSNLIKEIENKILEKELQKNL